MILREQMEEAIALQSEEILPRKERSIAREAAGAIDAGLSHIQIISGVRRCGKSTLMLQLTDLFENPAYLNFEDPRLFGFETSDLIKLDDILGRDRDAYFFDEIQVIPQWEVFVRNLHERGKKVFVTGSNASMLSSELGTHLTGRYLGHELFPFNLDEFREFSGEKGDDSAGKYLHLGGFPEFLQQGNRDIHLQLFRDILFRDIAVRHRIKNTHDLENLALYLLTNIGKEVTMNRIGALLEIASVKTVSDYLYRLRDAYLIFILPRFAYSARKIIKNPRKIYAVDTGLVRSVTLSSSRDEGRLLENMVYLRLRQEKGELYYFRERGECDFVLMRDKKLGAAVQVCLRLHDDNKDREIRGLLEALEFFGADEGTIVTLDQEDSLQVGGKRINVVKAEEFGG